MVIALLARCGGLCPIAREDQAMEQSFKPADIEQMRVLAEPIIEAYRQEEITRRKLWELAGQIGLSEEHLLRILEENGLSQEEEHSALLPEGL
jgi:hypothetical protein